MWTRVKKLGMGGFAVVFLAIASPSSFGLPPLMAVKSAPVLQSRSLRREIAFLNEFGTCPSVLGCFGDEVTVERGVLFYNIFLEYAAGGSLGHRVRSSGVGLPEIDVKRYVKSVLNGLRDIHKRGFVHCDIKPDNILLVVKESDSDSDSSISSSSSSSSLGLDCNKRKRVEESTAKIADFGLAKRAGERLKTRGGKGKLRGTALYMAPESIVNGEYEPESDIWALGCTVLELLTGTEPWKFDTNAATEAFLNVVGFTEQLPEIPVGLSKEAQDFLRKCLARDPKSRWTADMLLNHSFVCPLDCRVTGRDRNRVVVVPRAAKAVCDSSTRSEFDVLKPNLIMSHLASDGIVPCWLNSCITTKHSGVIASEESPACKKRRVEEEEDAEQGYMSDDPSSSISIEIFN